MKFCVQLVPSPKCSEAPPLQLSKKRRTTSTESGSHLFPSQIPPCLSPQLLAEYELRLYAFASKQPGAYQNLAKERLFLHLSMHPAPNNPAWRVSRSSILTIRQNTSRRTRLHTFSSNRGATVAYASDKFPTPDGALQLR